MEDVIIPLKPESFTFFKGQDGKDYLLLENSGFYENGSSYYYFILNDNFEKLSLSLNNKLMTSFVFYNDLGTLINLNPYSKVIGYHSKKNINDNTNIYVNSGLINGKFRFFNILSDSSVFCNKKRVVQEYEFVINDNEISVQKLDEFAVFYDTVQTC